MAFYAQDTWKLTRKLTFDYDLRLVLRHCVRELHNRNTSSFAPLLQTPCGWPIRRNQTSSATSPAGSVHHPDRRPRPVGNRLPITRTTAKCAGCPRTVGTRPFVPFPGTISSKIRGESFNVSNRVQFANPTSGKCPASAGQDSAGINDGWTWLVNPASPQQEDCSVIPRFIASTSNRAGALNSLCISG